MNTIPLQIAPIRQSAPPIEAPRDIAMSALQLDGVGAPIASLTAALNSAGRYEIAIGNTAPPLGTDRRIATERLQRRLHLWVEELATCFPHLWLDHLVIDFSSETEASPLYQSLPSATSATRAFRSFERALLQRLEPFAAQASSPIEIEIDLHSRNPKLQNIVVIDRASLVVVLGRSTVDCGHVLTQVFDPFERLQDALAVWLTGTVKMSIVLRWKQLSAHERMALNAAPDCDAA
jgi:hypothetical protein